MFIQIKPTIKIKSTDDSKIINRLVANELIKDLFSYLSYSYPNSYLCPTYHLVFYQY